jgi:tRNA (guanine10-N2)-methyltransferase
VAEWLTRQIANLLSSGRASSNLAGVAMSFVLWIGCKYFHLAVEEVLSLAEYFDLKNVIVDLSGPFLYVHGISEWEFKLLVSRSVLCKDGYECYSKAGSRHALLAQVQQQNQKKVFDRFQAFTFKFEVSLFGKKCSLEEKLFLIHEYSFLKLGSVDLGNPDVRFVILAKASHSKSSDEEWCFCRHVQQTRRKAISKYNLKERRYIGTTSMDAELSLAMSNLARVGCGSLVCDPFVGTGSFLMTSAEFGAYSLGSDIDGRQLRGTGSVDIDSNSKQYGLEHLMLGTMISDITCSPWRPQSLFDAVITDPPYGIRAGAKRIKETQKPRKIDPMNPPYPSTEPYPLDQVMQDLIGFSAQHLLSGGRLVYWQPCANKEVPKVPENPRMRLVSRTEQKLGAWSRWLIVMEKFK